MNTAQNLFALGISIALVSGAAAFGALFPPGEWYGALEKPPFNPPAWVFGPAWTILYALMAVAAWLIWLRRDVQPVAVALGAYALQLVLNAAWSAIFFGAHAMGWAFAELCVLWVCIAAAIALFWRVRPVAGVLLLPYIAWVTFAGILNFTIWRLNG
ncbi:MAG: TspO/MBR family protein [Candidatus Hydrogenedentota bacterium]